MKNHFLTSLIFMFCTSYGIHFASNHRQCVSFGPYSYYDSIEVVHFGEPATFSVGKFCSIANIKLFLGGDHRVDWVSTYPFMSFTKEFPAAKNIPGHPKTKGNIVIGNDVWIGQDAVIMSGITIGDGAVIGARTLVSKNVPAYAIFAGNPGKVVRYRFDKHTIEKLLLIKWWNWPIEKIKANVHVLCSSNLIQLIDKD